MGQRVSRHCPPPYRGFVRRHQSRRRRTRAAAVCPTILSIRSLAIRARRVKDDTVEDPAMVRAALSAASRHSLRSTKDHRQRRPLEHHRRHRMGRDQLGHRQCSHLQPRHSRGPSALGPRDQTDHLSGHHRPDGYARTAQSSRECRSFSRAHCWVTVVGEVGDPVTGIVFLIHQLETLPR